MYRIATIWYTNISKYADIEDLKHTSSYDVSIIYQRVNEINVTCCRQAAYLTTKIKYTDTESKWV